MAIPVTNKPIYPSVPKAPGVPSVLRIVTSAQNNAILLVEDALLIVKMFSTPQWGLFTTAGQPAFASGSSGFIASVLTALRGKGWSVGQVEFRFDHRVATAPQEQGTFMAYNKVSTPFAGRVSYNVSGTEAQRGDFIKQVLAAQMGITLFDLVMPEYTYRNCNVVHHDLRRTARDGVTMFAIDIWVEEIRISGVATYSNAATASGNNAVNGGTVQAFPASNTGRVAGPV